MIENLFEIVNKQQTENSQPASAYPNFHKQFITSNYGYYTPLFTSHICEQAQNSQENYRKLNAKKLLKEIIKKFMLSDLELVFVAYFCNKHQWRLVQTKGKAPKKDASAIDKIQHDFQLFLEFNAYFVKSYIGDLNEFNAIKAQIAKIYPGFIAKYTEWALNQPRQNFMITPRQINMIYRSYTLGCQEKETKKDYNDMVEKIMELSATYSIIPGSKEKQEDKNNIINKDIEPSSNNQIKQSSKLSSISEKNQQSIGKYGKTNKKSSNKQSILQCIDASNRYKNMGGPSKFDSSRDQRLSLLRASHEKREKERESVEWKNIQRQRSREKNPGKKLKSLNFRQKEQPNDLVLDVFKKTNQDHPPEQGGNKDPNKSFLQMNLKDYPNLSWMDLGLNRSNRSNRSSSLPMPWKPNDGGFFDKSHFG